MNDTKQIVKGSKKLTLCDELKTITLGGFKVKPFPVQHDIHTLGFIVNHPEIGQLIFATDTYFLKYKFPGTTTWLIEANYDEHILDANIKAGKLNRKMKRRVFQSHMEISQTIDTLKANDLSSTRNIVLIHLSDGNSNEKEFIERTIKATGIPNVYAAKKGLTINIDKNLF